MKEVKHNIARNWWDTAKAGLKKEEFVAVNTIKKEKISNSLMLHRKLQKAQK